MVEIPTPSGTLALPIAGVVREYSDQQGSLLLDQAVFREKWGDDSVNLFRVYVEKSADPAIVKQRILARFSGNRRVFVLENAEARTYITSVTDQWFRLTWLQTAIAVIVAALGIMNSLTVSIADRRRELGVLKAVGGLRRQIRNAIWMEAAAVGFLSVVLGLIVGAVHLYCVLELGARDYPGLRFDYAFPFAVAGVIFPIVVSVAILAAIVPAESAVREPVMEALAYE
jgi:putative ABC transport system permease protein